MAEKDLGSRYSFIKMLELSDPSGALKKLGENLFENNEMLQDFTILPASGAVSHQDLRPTSIPTPQIVAIGDGWDASVVNWDSFSDGISMFKDRAQFPEDVLRRRE